MNRLLLLFGFIAIFATKSFAQEPIYTVSPYEDSLWVYDTTSNSTTSAVQLTVSGTPVTITGCNGLATNECTGETFIIYKANGIGRFLGTVDLNTGIIDSISDTGENIAQISFVNDTTLIAVSGDGGNVSEALYYIHTGTGVASLITASGGAGSDGECIGYCPDNGLAYRWSGRDSSPAMESWDLSDTTMTTITRTGYNYDEPYGVMYIGGGEFLMANIDQELIIIDTTGFATLQTFTTGTEFFKGLTFGGASIWFDQAASDSICPFGDTTLLVASAADSYQWYMDGNPITDATDSVYSAVTEGDYQCEITKGLCTSLTAKILTVSTYLVDTAMVLPLLPEFCVGDSVVLNGSMVSDSSEWWLGGAIVDMDTSYTALAGGTLTYRLFSGINGCYDELDVIVTENAIPVVMANADEPFYCDGDMVTLTGSGDPATYTWNNSVDDGVAFAQAISTVTYMVTALDANGCSDSVEIDVTVSEIPTSSSTFVDETLGNDGSIDLTVTGTGPFTFDWDNDGTGDQDDTEDLSGLVAGTYTVIVYGPTGCSTTETVVVGSTVGLNEFGMNASMSIFPNPNNGEFTISFADMNTENVSVQIINSLGQVISTSKVNNNKVNADISSAGPGVYMIQITDGKNIATERIVVE
jgi:hypothetical protein